MGWVEEQFEETTGPRGPAGTVSPRELSVEARIQQKWQQMLQEFQADVAEFRQLNGDATFEQVSEWQCRVTNNIAHLAAVITADPELHVLRYNYQSESPTTAAPEEGILTFRPSGNAVRTYSSDQRLSLEQVRALILEPVLFPATPSDKTIAA